MHRFGRERSAPAMRPLHSPPIRPGGPARRTELLAALLTIWRWGRVADDIKPGIRLGSFADAETIDDAASGVPLVLPRDALALIP